MKNVNKQIRLVEDPFVFETLLQTGNNQQGGKCVAEWSNIDLTVNSHTYRQEKCG